MSAGYRFEGGNVYNQYLTETNIESLTATDFVNLTLLNSIILTENEKLRTIEQGTFDNLIEVTRIDVTHSPLLKNLDQGVFGYLPHLSSLSFEKCGLERIPNLTSLVNENSLKKLVFSDNKIYSLEPYSFSTFSFEIYTLTLSGNDISTVPGRVFAGAKITVLILSKNPISEVDDNMFDGIEGLREVYLSDTSISRLPTKGLKDITLLDIQGTPNLKHFPPLFRFQSISTAKLHYFSHCCAFYYNTTENTHMAKMHNITEAVEDVDCPTSTSQPVRSASPFEFLDNREASIPRGSREILDEYIQSAVVPPNKESSMGHSFFIPVNNESLMAVTGEPFIGPFGADDTSDMGFREEVVDPHVTHVIYGSTCHDIVPKNYSKVNCSPLPDPFNPCSDVMGYPFLRVIVWFIASTAMIGNLVVMVVLIAYRHKMTVPKFLMCNLAFADFCMGIYLLMVAAVDVHTLGAYFNYAIDWQFGAGCKIAGFISVFSSELSVFTLTVLTIERWYTIIYAIDLNKRIRLRQAGRILLGGWFFAIVIASLPFLGVAGYGVTSMCLPFYVRKTDSAAAVAYVIFILLFNALAFIVICACYIKMYVTVRNPHSAMQRKDSKVAKRMAVLIFTDLACWAPIAINGLSSIFNGKNALLTTDQTKVFIVLFYPINSCANPFLYAIFTRAFRRDLFLLLAKHGMCEKRAMKYRPTYTSSPRSMSQVNSTTMRDVCPKGSSHRGSSASVMTQITSDARPSMVSFDKESPDNSPKMNIELQFVVTPGSSLQSQIPEDTSISNQLEVSHSPNTGSKAGGIKKLNEYSYILDGLPPVPEEHNSDRPEPSSKPFQTELDDNLNPCRPGNPLIIEHCVSDNFVDMEPVNRESSSLLSYVAGNGDVDAALTNGNRTDIGIQSVTPNDHEVNSKLIQMNLTKADDVETTL
ncbi:follicle-stimulating hormone receptor-like [Asterias rubens]|uniref:follicle-stimulating hormone receptor-like n=1 Tax=Asterias rubens TaxID=7604 RepID=UPI001454EC64|nr:follicle-stimulating hormone receptor-like [Asterias rubens]